MAARFVRDEEAAGSNPATPTIKAQVTDFPRECWPGNTPVDVRFWECSGSRSWRGDTYSARYGGTAMAWRCGDMGIPGAAVASTVGGSRQRDPDALPDSPDPSGRCPWCGRVSHFTRQTSSFLPACRRQRCWQCPSESLSPPTSWLPLGNRGRTGHLLGVWVKNKLKR